VSPGVKKEEQDVSATVADRLKPTLTPAVMRGATPGYPPVSSPPRPLLLSVSFILCFLNPMTSLDRCG